MNKLFLAFALLTSTLAYAQQLETVTVGGNSRTMMVYAPSGLEENAPLVISLHGANQDAAYQRDQTKWNNCADTAKFVVVYPNAINKFWDTSGQSDINYISWIIDEMADRYQINRNRVYITGFSLGAMMTYHCIEHLGDKVAAFGPVSGVRFDNRKPTAPRRVPIIHTHGTGDDVFKWVGDPNHMAGGYPYIPDYVESWATYEDLTEKEVISPYPSSKPNSIATLTVWRSADPGDDIEVALLALKDKGHWHSEDLASGVSTTQEIWKFCKRYSLQPEPPKVKAVEPEDMSFDLTGSATTFTLTFSDFADASILSATLTSADKEIALVSDDTDAENEGKVSTITYTVPESETLADGEYHLIVTGIKNPEGGNEKSATFTYFYGQSEYGDQVKAAFQVVYNYAIEIYQQSEGATAMSVVNARNRLKRYIDKYVDFVSTAPSAYAKATENLTKNFEPIETYLQSLGITSAIIDTDATQTEYYGIDGTRISAPQPGISIMVKKLSNGDSIIQKIYR